MKKLFCMVLALCMLMVCTCASASSFSALQDMLRNSSSTAEATQAPEAPADAEEPAQNGILVADCMDGLGVSQYNVIAVDSINYVYVYMYIEVTNNGDRAVEVDGEIAVMDAAGTVVEDQSYLNAYPSVIAPGETAYVSDYVMVSKTDSVASDADIAQVKLSLFRDAYNRDPSLPTYVQSAVEFGSGYDSYGRAVDNAYRAAVLNNTGDDLINPYVVVAMYGADGQLLYVSYDHVKGFGTLSIPNGNGFFVTNHMPQDLSDSLAKKGMVVTSAKSVAYCE